jgi:hypothetical protein
VASQMALSLPLPISVPAPQRILLPDPRDQATATERLSVLQLLFDYRGDPERFGALRLLDGTPVSSATRMLAYIAETTGTSERTLKYWLARYQTGGLANLADRTRRDKNQSRFFAAYPRAAWLIAYLFLECRSSCKVCHEAIVRDAKLIEVPPEELPSYETVRAWLRSMPPSLQVYARKGRKAYRDQMSPYLKRAFTDVYANEVWVGDLAIMDIEASNDVFENVEYGSPLRIRLDANLDYRSRLLVGYSFCWEGSSRSVAATMIRGIRKYGPPVFWYTDNGAAQKKAAKGAQPGYLVDSPLPPKDWRKTEIESIESTGFLARAGIAVQHALPFHPQAKAIERFFRTMHERFDKCWPTYTSGSPFTRPDATTALMVHHRKCLAKGHLEKSHHPRVSQIIAAFMGWAEEYGNTPHSGEGCEGLTPRQVFEANRNPAQKPTPDPATLALLMAEHQRRMVQECAIRLNNRRYVPVDPCGWEALHNLNQCEILIAYEPGAPEDAAALDLDGNFVAALQAEEMARFAPSDPHTKAQVSESMRQRRHLEKTTREALQTISLVARQNGALTPLEAMAKRLQFPASTDLADVVTQRPSKFNPNDNPSSRPTTPAEAARIFLERQNA